MNDLFGLDLTEILNFVETLATVGALYFTIVTIKENTRSNQTRFVNEVYEDFQELQLAILDNPETLKIIARESKENKKEVRKNSLAALLINNSYKLFRLHQNKHIPPDLWERFQGDMKGLFGWEFVLDRWFEIQTFYPTAFQLFINENILSQKSD